jgi:hypothetical protein
MSNLVELAVDKTKKKSVIFKKLNKTIKCETDKEIIDIIMKEFDDGEDCLSDLLHSTELHGCSIDEVLSISHDVTQIVYTRNRTEPDIDADIAEGILDTL